MGLVSGRVIILLLILFVGFGWAIGNGFVRWEKDPYKCAEGKWFQSVVPQQRLMTIGALHLYYQPVSWDCREEAKYDPKQYHMVDGLLVPIAH